MNLLDRAPLYIVFEFQTWYPYNYLTLIFNYLTIQNHHLYNCPPMNCTKYNTLPEYCTINIPDLFFLLQYSEKSWSHIHKTSLSHVWYFKQHIQHGLKILIEPSNL